MSVINISRDDMLRSKVVEPGWYVCEVLKTSEKPAKTDGSTRWIVETRIVQPGPFQGVPIEVSFSEKAPSFAVSFIEALGGKIDVDKGASFNLDAAVGKKLAIFIANEKYENRLINRATDYRAA